MPISVPYQLEARLLEAFRAPSEEARTARAAEVLEEFRRPDTQEIPAVPHLSFALRMAAVHDAPGLAEHVLLQEGDEPQEVGVALRSAAKRAHVGVVRAIRECNSAPIDSADVVQALRRAVISGHLPTVEAMLEFPGPSPAQRAEIVADAIPVYVGDNMQKGDLGAVLRCFEAMSAHLPAANLSLAYKRLVNVALGKNSAELLNYLAQRISLTDSVAWNEVVLCVFARKFLILREMIRHGWAPPPYVRLLEDVRGEVENEGNPRFYIADTSSMSAPCFTITDDGHTESVALARELFAADKR